MIQAFKFMGTFSPPVTNPGSESTAINERAFQPLPNGSRTIVGASPGAGAFTGADMPQAASPSHTGGEYRTSPNLLPHTGAPFVFRRVQNSDDSYLFPYSLVPASSRGPIKSAKPSKATRATRATKFPQRALHTIVETSSGGAGPSSGAGESQVASTSHTGGEQLFPLHSTHIGSAVLIQSSQTSDHSYPSSYSLASSSIGPIKGAKPSKAKRAVKTPKKSNGKNPRL